MQCTSELDVRGMAVVEEGTAATSFAELTSKAHCAVTVDAGDRPYQGIVEIDDTSLAASLEHYFARSVQVPSHVALLANDEFAAGILLQQVPGEPIDEDDLDDVKPRAERLEKSLRAVLERDPRLAREVAEDDLEIDRLDVEVDQRRGSYLARPRSNF